MENDSIFLIDSENSNDELNIMHISTDPNQIILRSLDIQPLETNQTQKQRKVRVRSRSQSEKLSLGMFRDKNGFFPKKEYLRCKVIRAYKRAIRQAIEKKIPKNKLHEVIISNLESRKAWERFCEHCESDKEYFGEISKTEKGPKTDGKSKRVEESTSKSFNDTYCADFFRPPKVREFYQLFLGVVFSVPTCKILSKKFELSHCQKICIDCHRKWDILKKYLQKDMFVDLGLELEEVNF